MNLYLISSIAAVGYDEYDSFVVAAETETAARTAAANHVSHAGYTDEEARDTTWGNPTYSTGDLIGAAAPGVTAGVVLASFNAG